VLITKLCNAFPEGYTPTDQQVKLLNKIDDCLQRHKFVICCAPTGSGKSMIARSLANTTEKPSSEFTDLITSYNAFKQDFSGNYVYEQECLEEPAFGSFVLTITKSLQDQYISLFSDTDVLKGKTNYVCDVDDNFMVDLAPCTLASAIKDDCCSKNRCAYYNARNDALLSQFGALNYKMFLALPAHVKKKNIIICDEASELEDELIRQFSAEIQYDKLRQFGIDIKALISDNQTRARAWVYDLLEKITNETEGILSIMSKNPRLITKSDKIKYQYLKNLHKLLESVDSLWSKIEYIIDYNASQVSFTPLDARELSRHIFDHADKVVLMSATIIDHKHFAQSLGISDYGYVEEESGFDPEKSPIYISSACKLNYKNLKIEMPNICNQIKQIVDHHKNEKGIIHTHTLEITNIIKDKVGYSPRYLFRDISMKNEEILKQHYNSQEPTILVSPSLAFGVDLKDDLARFQIIVKLPYPPLSSKRIKKMFDRDKIWYENKMLNSIVQAAGRATRSADDHSVTYILDGSFINVITRSKNRLPKHFIERIH